MNEKEIKAKSGDYTFKHSENEDYYPEDNNLDNIYQVKLIKNQTEYLLSDHSGRYWYVFSDRPLVLESCLKLVMRKKS